jgi:hypothetical protein
MGVMAQFLPSDVVAAHARSCMGCVFTAPTACVSHPSEGRTCPPRAHRSRGAIATTMNKPRTESRPYDDKSEDKRERC